MDVTLHPTSRIVDIHLECSSCTERHAIPARVWEGTTDTGVPVAALIPRLAADRDHDQAALQAALREVQPPGRVGTEAFPMRLIL